MLIIVVWNSHRGEEIPPAGTTGTRPLRVLSPERPWDSD